MLYKKLCNENQIFLLSEEHWVTTEDGYILGKSLLSLLITDSSELKFIIKDIRKYFQFSIVIFVD